MGRGRQWTIREKFAVGVFVNVAWMVRITLRIGVRLPYIWLNYFIFSLLR